MYFGSNHRVEGAMFDFQGLGEGTGFLDKQCLQKKIYGPPDVKFGGHVEFLRSLYLYFRCMADLSTLFRA